MNEAFENILDGIESLKSNKGFGGTVQTMYADGMLDKAKQIVQEVAEEYNNGWIPCSEGLPEEYGDYLVWWTDITRKQYYEIVEYEPNNGWIGEIPQAVEGIYSVIAWQPLPEPFKERD